MGQTTTKHQRRRFSLVTWSVHLDVSRSNVATTDVTASDSSSSSCNTTLSTDFQSTTMIPLAASHYDGTTTTHSTATSMRRRRVSFAGVSWKQQQQQQDTLQSIDWDERALQRFLSSYCCRDPDASCSSSSSSSSSRGLLDHTNTTDVLWHAVERISAVLNNETHTNTAVVLLEGHTLLGGLFLTLQRPKLAIASFLNALWIATAATDSTLSIGMALHRLGKAYHSNGQWSDAISTLQKAMQVYDSSIYDASVLSDDAKQLWTEAVRRRAAKRPSQRRLDSIQEEEP